MKAAPELLNCCAKGWYILPARTWPRRPIQDPICTHYQNVSPQFGRYLLLCDVEGGIGCCAPGNPKHIARIDDLTRRDITITNREPGAGCRCLLDDLLKKAGIACATVKGYDRITLGQLPAARLVKSGEVDCCINTQAAATSLGLEFIPLAEKPFLLVLRRANLKVAPVHALIETLGRSAYRREVEACLGYDMHTAGERLV